MPPALEAAQKAAVGAACGYEVVALCSGGRVPTISALLGRCHRNRRAALTAALCGWFVLHLPWDA